MYQFTYASIDINSVADGHDRDKQLMSHAIDLLDQARAAGPRSRQATQAVLFLQRIWTAFVDDLEAPENTTPKELRAHLLSIGGWLLREAEAVRVGRSNDIDALLDVSRSIRAGLD